jgi:hypothetical protein
MNCAAVIIEWRNLTCERLVWRGFVMKLCKEMLLEIVAIEFLMENCRFLWWKSWKGCWKFHKLSRGISELRITMLELQTSFCDSFSNRKLLKVSKPFLSSSKTSHTIDDPFQPSQTIASCLTNKYRWVHKCAWTKCLVAERKSYSVLCYCK